MRRLELLSPAKNLQCGVAAIDCGADAVYIGAPKFGARVAAGNSLDDIARLTEYAHRFGARVYVTLNTILYDEELPQMRSLLEGVCRIGVDAILVQDMAMLEMAKATGIVLHASTQTDNRSREKVAWLESLGFSRVVLARELSLEEIRQIHEASPDVELEAFVHGALCVSYSGACYASQYCFKRSANRGECAQFCRMRFDLEDSRGEVIRRQSHLLSLKDLSLIDHLEELADAGVVSFKIEGRLKDEDYVRNVVAAYSQKLDGICRRRASEYCRASLGEVSHAFKPDLRKTFNRGYSEYFFGGRKPGIYSPDTPKATGEEVARVVSVTGNSITVDGPASFSNGDGLCFFSAGGELVGFRVNRAEGSRLFPHIMPGDLRPGMTLYRNSDVAFEKLLLSKETRRTLPIRLTFSTTGSGFSLRAQGRGLQPAVVEVEFPHQTAKKPQRENILSQLSRWGNTIYSVDSIDIEPGAEGYFIPSSLLSTLRRNLAEALDAQDRCCSPLKARPEMADDATLEERKSGVIFKNVSNSISRELHRSWGVEDFQTAPEVDPSGFSLPLMQCRHCLRFALGHCVKHGGVPATWKEPLFLRLSDGRRFRLEFDCGHCQMNVYKE